MVGIGYHELVSMSGWVSMSHKVDVIESPVRDFVRDTGSQLTECDRQLFKNRMNSRSYHEIKILYNEKFGTFFSFL